ncbi:hypothetical protein MBLNU13_g11693t2 [Cladosporium sp. NU13]
MARFKRTMSARGTVAAPKISFAETADETSSEESICEPVFEEIGAATSPRVANNDIAIMKRRHDSVLEPAAEQTATSSSTCTLTSRPLRKDLRAALRALQDPRQQPGAPCTRADDMALDDEDDEDEERLANWQRRVHDGHALLDLRQRELDQIAAGLDEEEAAREAQEVAAAQERAWEAQIRAAREQREAASRRLAKRIVAEIVPMSASGRAYGNAAEIRRCTAPKVEYQMVPDGNYPRFRPWPQRGQARGSGIGRES